jgi:hypothetical protein
MLKRITCVSAKHEYEWKKKERNGFFLLFLSYSVICEWCFCYVYGCFALFFYRRPYIQLLATSNERYKKKAGERKRRENACKEDETIAIVRVYTMYTNRMTLCNVILLIRKTSIFIKYTNLLQLPSFSSSNECLASQGE